MFNDLMKKLREKGFMAFAYADDLAIIGICKVKLMEAMDIVEEWVEMNKLTINKKKSGIMIHDYQKKARK
jgi:hypothetical protein